MIEVHAAPMQALCDGPQSLLPSEFATLSGELRALKRLLAGSEETFSQC